MNERTTEDLVRLIELDGEQVALYRTFPIDLAILRGTTAAVDGNVPVEREALTLQAQAIAIAARNAGDWSSCRSGGASWGRWDS